MVLVRMVLGCEMWYNIGMRMRERLRRGCALIAVAGLLAVELMGGITSVAFAKKLDANTLDFFSNNNIFYYDPNACQDNKKCVPPTGDQITWIGDSYSVGAKDKIESKLSGISFGGSVDDANSTIQGSKFIDSGGASNPSGLSILQKMKDAGELKPIVVFALGTNGGNDAKKIDKVMDIVGDDVKVVFTTIYVAPNASSEVRNYVSSTNTAVNNAKNSHKNVSVADWAAVAKDEYYKSDSSGVHPFDGYDVWVDTIVKALPENCTDGVLLPGTNVTEKVWNWLVNYFNGQNLGNKNIAALASGIMGNFYWETGMNPLMANKGYYGIFMYYGPYGGDAYAAKVNAALGGNYFKYYQGSNDETVDGILKDAGLSDEDIDVVINLNLEAMVEGSYWSEFLEGVKDWGVADTPRGYSDLFVTTMERAPGGSALLEDAGVKKHYSGNYQIADKRRDRAEHYYNEYASSTSINPTITTGSAANAARSSASMSATVGTNKNYAGDTVWSDEQMSLVEKYQSTYQSAGQQYGIPWQAIATVHRLETSLALKNPNNGQGLFQLYSYTGGGKNSNAFRPGEIDMTEFERQANLAAGEMKKMIESGGYTSDSDEGIKYLFFYYNGTATKYKEKALAMGFSEEEAKIGEGSPYVMNRYDARRDPNSSEMDPNWPGRFTADGVYTEGAKQSDFGAYVLYTALGGGTGGSGDMCEKPSGSGNLADLVLEYAWPEYHPAVFLEVKPGYKEVYDRRVREGKYVGSQKTYGDCGGFVTTLLQESGFDPNYGGGGNTYTQEMYVVQSPDWELVNPSYNTPIRDESELQPGDVAFNTCGSAPGSCKHTYVYVGEISGFGAHIASASWDRRTPMAGHEQIVAQGVNWYHKVK